LDASDFAKATADKRWTSDAREVVYGDCDHSAAVRAGSAQGRLLRQAQDKLLRQAQDKLFHFAPVCDWRFYLRVLKKDVEIKRFYLTGKWLIWYKK